MISCVGDLVQPLCDGCDSHILALAKPYRSAMAGVAELFACGCHGMALCQNNHGFADVAGADEVKKFCAADLVDVPGSPGKPGIPGNVVIVLSASTAGAMAPIAAMAFIVPAVPNAVAAGCGELVPGSHGLLNCPDGSNAPQKFIMVSMGDSTGLRYQERAVDVLV